MGLQPIEPFATSTLAFVAEDFEPGPLPALGLPASVSYGAGNEHNPGDPFGRFALTVSAAGDAELEQHRRGREPRTWTGRMDVGQLREVWSALRLGGFPEAPRHPLPAGATMRRVAVASVDGEQRVAMVEWNAGATLDGYRVAFELLDDFILKLGGGGIVG